MVAAVVGKVIPSGQTKISLVVPFRPLLLLLEDLLEWLRCLDFLEFDLLFNCRLRMLRPFELCVSSVCRCRLCVSVALLHGLTVGDKTLIPFTTPSTSEDDVLLLNKSSSPGLKQRQNSSCWANATEVVAI